MQRWAIGAASAALTFASWAAFAHDGVVHGSAEEAAAHAAATNQPQPSPQLAAPPLSEGPATPFPIDLEVSFDLIDQTGSPRKHTDFAGQPMAIFFGYANCEAICSVALPRLASAIDLLGEEAESLAPILVTVDPERDTPEAMAEALPKYHPRLIGLTGSDEKLAEAMAAFQVEAQQVYTDYEGNPVYAHGSYIYVIDGKGQLAAVLPPILGPDRMAEIISKYL